MSENAKIALYEFLGELRSEFSYYSMFSSLNKINK